jgi:6-phosphogluconolactonase
MTQYLLYVGTYTENGSQGIYAYRFDPESADLAPIGLAAETVNPSFLAIDDKRKLVYAVVETMSYKGSNGGALRAYRTDCLTGKLAVLNEVRSMGTGPCYISFDESGSYILLANYHSGSVAVFPLLEDGSLAEASAFVQHGSDGVSSSGKVPHAHAFHTSPDNRFALAADLGLETLLVYEFDAGKGSISATNPSRARVQDGAGPRHFVFHPRGKFVYLLNELASQVVVFDFNAKTGALQERQSLSLLPAGFSGQNSAAEVRIDRLGSYLYASNRGHDSIAVFAIDANDGSLTPVQHVGTGGATPRGFAIDPTGRLLIVANEDSDNIVFFHIDPLSGKLAPTGQVYSVPSPTYIAFMRIDDTA